MLHPINSEISALWQKKKKRIWFKHTLRQRLPRGLLGTVGWVWNLDGFAHLRADDAAELNSLQAVHAHLLLQV